MTKNTKPVIPPVHPAKEEHPVSLPAEEEKPIIPEEDPGPVPDKEFTEFPDEPPTPGHRA